MSTVYALTNIKTSQKGRVTAELTENGVVIAKTVKPAAGRWVLPFETKFLSTQSKARFDAYCNCLSVSETVESLYHSATNH